MNHLSIVHLISSLKVLSSYTQLNQRKQKQSRLTKPFFKKYWNNTLYKKLAIVFLIRKIIYSKNLYYLLMFR